MGLSRVRLVLSRNFLRWRLGHLSLCLIVSRLKIDFWVQVLGSRRKVGQFLTWYLIRCCRTYLFIKFPLVDMFNLARRFHFAGNIHLCCGLDLRRRSNLCYRLDLRSRLRLGRWLKFAAWLGHRRWADRLPKISADWLGGIDFMKRFSADWLPASPGRFALVASLGWASWSPFGPAQTSGFPSCIQGVPPAILPIGLFGFLPLREPSESKLRTLLAAVQTALSPSLALRGRSGSLWGRYSLSIRLTAPGIAFLTYASSPAYTERWALSILAKSSCCVTDRPSFLIAAVRLLSEFCPLWVFWNENLFRRAVAQSRRYR